MLPKINSSHGSETRNIINAAIDAINVQGKSIQDLVAEGQLTEEQYSNLINTVNGMLKSGEVGEYDLTPELRAEVDKVKDKIDAGDVTEKDITGELKALIDTIPNKINHGNVSVEDIDKNKGKFDQTYMSSSLLSQITGNAPINAVPANNSLTTEKYVDNSVTKNKKTIGGETATVLTWNKIPDIDLVNKKVTFYSDTAIVHSKGRNVITTDISVDFLPGRTSIFLYNTSTNTFRSTASSNSNTLTEDEVFVTQISFTSTSQNELINVAGNLEYTVDGKNRIIKDSVHRDEIEDGAVSISKTDFIEVENFYNKNDIVHGVVIDQNTGLENDNAQYNASGFISMTENSDIYLKYITRVTYYDNQKEIITSYSPTPFEGGGHTTPLKTSFIRLTVHNNYVEDAMVYLGTEDRAYEPFNVKILGRRIFQGTDEKMYFPPEEIKPQFIAPDYDYKRMTLQEYYEAFDDLVSAHPEHLIKTVFGKDESGQYDVIQHHYIPPSYHNDEGKIARPKPKITFISNVHGFEKPTALATYYMIKAILEDWRTNDAIEYLRSNVEMVFIAIANPYGYVNGTYKNGNPDVPVNIQTNFPINWLLRDPSSSVYGGTEPLSERETQYISQMIQEHSDALFFVDSHSAGSVATQTPENMFYFIGPYQQGLYNEIIEESMKNSVENLSRELSKHYLHDFEGVSGYYYLRPGNGNTEPYAASLGVPAYVSELFYSLPDDELAYQPTAIKAMTETFANTLLTTLKTFKERM